MVYRIAGEAPLGVSNGTIRELIGGDIYHGSYG
jgi:hypothetical protein